MNLGESLLNKPILMTAQFGVARKDARRLTATQLHLARKYRDEGFTREAVAKALNVGVASLKGVA